MTRFLPILASFMLAFPLWAQSYPDKPVRMVVPFPPGGPLDLVARVFATPMSEKLGQTFIVENRAGATGNIGMEAVSRAQPDGYTLVWVIDSMLTVNPTVFPAINEPLERLRPIGIVAENISTLAVNPSLGVKSVAEFIKVSNAKDLSYASAGAGSPGHRYMELFKMITGAKATHVPYGGNAAGVQSLVAGETQAFISPIAGVLQQVRAGKLLALAVSSAGRTASLPAVPTMAEAGYPKFTTVAWFGVYVPARIPQAVFNVLESEMQRVTQLPDVRERLIKAGSDAVWENQKSVIARVGAERKLWAEVIEKTGMKVE